ncbi:hypothetical protein SCE1572_52640 [Sorangium cellulosum So0157-2]|uniref:Uncharacterized protein n=1 Tax=Sorangium cellulosum So0157-2 TaxID=1254432 RepID=S4YDH1_SORCE|nr:hypothetical protein SCE1572_52640 [Sorangium cellulosum So0157-2]
MPSSTRARAAPTGSLALSRSARCWSSATGSGAAMCAA